MSQVPPPPPSQPAPMGGTPSGVGTNKKTYTILAYVLGWIGGLIFLFAGKDDPDVKWNAANSLILFGALSVIIAVLGSIPGINFIAALAGLVGFVYWIIFFVLSVQGNGERIPAPGLSGFLNPYVDRLVDAVK